MKFKPTRSQLNAMALLIQGFGAAETPHPSRSSYHSEVDVNGIEFRAITFEKLEEIGMVESGFNGKNRSWKATKLGKLFFSEYIKEFVKNNFSYKTKEIPNGI